MAGTVTYLFEALAAAVVCAVLLVRSRKIRIFGGVDLTKDAGWDELKASIRLTALEVIR